MATPDMAIACWDTICAYLDPQAPAASSHTYDGATQVPLFVTWEIVEPTTSSSSAAAGEGSSSKRPRSRSPSPPPEYVLRGCIGCLSPIPLDRLAKYAIMSSMKDRRFEPIVAAELPLLQCSVSLLIDYEDAADYMDWTIDTHGILIDFACPASRRTYSATYLPEVCGEQGWARREAVESLVRKSGYQGGIDDRLLGSIKVGRGMGVVALSGGGTHEVVC